jgi:hypothetical protein
VNLINCRLDYGEGVVCGFLWGGSGIDKDIRFELGKTRAYMVVWCRGMGIAMWR